MPRTALFRLQLFKHGLRHFEGAVVFDEVAHEELLLKLLDRRLRLEEREYAPRSRLLFLELTAAQLRVA